MEYNLPSYGFVKLKVIDITGRELLQIVNRFQPKGKYSYTFGASDFETGIYYYQLSFNNNIITKKMVLIK
jgi:hypothetical protein